MFAEVHLLHCVCFLQLKCEWTLFSESVAFVTLSACSPFYTWLVVFVAACTALHLSGILIQYAVCVCVLTLFLFFCRNDCLSSSMPCDAIKDLKRSCCDCGCMVYGWQGLDGKKAKDASASNSDVNVATCIGVRIWYQNSIPQWTIEEIWLPFLLPQTCR